MHRLLKPLGLIFALMVILGCQALSLPFSSTPTPAPEPTNRAESTAAPHRVPALKGDWHITLNRSGGIAGTSRSVDISSNGDMTLSDLISNKSSQSSLSPDKMSALAGLVTTIYYEPVSSPSGCADCFIFDLKISNDSESFQVELNQIDLAKSGLQPLVDYLGEYLNTIIK